MQQEILKEKLFKLFDNYLQYNSNQSNQDINSNRQYIDVMKEFSEYFSVSEAAKRFGDFLNFKIELLEDIFSSEMIANIKNSIAIAEEIYQESLESSFDDFK